MSQHTSSRRLRLGSLLYLGLVLSFVLLGGALPSARYVEAEVLDSTAATVVVPRPEFVPINVPVKWRGIAFLCGVPGAVVLYYGRNKDSRIQKALIDRDAKEMRALCVDLCIFLVVGGLSAAFLVQYQGDYVKESFLIGTSWQGLVNAFGKDAAKPATP